MNLHWIIYKILNSSFRKKEKQLQKFCLLPDVIPTFFISRQLSSNLEKPVD